MEISLSSVAKTAAALGYLSNGHYSTSVAIGIAVARLAEANRRLEGFANPRHPAIAEIVAEAESEFCRLCVEAGFKAEVHWTINPPRRTGVVKYGRLQLVVPGSYWDESNPLLFEFKP